MAEFKYWHDENDGWTFSSQTRIGFNKCDANGKLQIYELLALTSDVAVTDFWLRGMDYKFLAEKGVALLVSRVSYRIIRMPCENEFITVKTWEEKNRGLQFVRKYSILDENGAELINADTTWLYVDVNSRRIIPAAKFDMRPQPTKSTELKSLEAGKIKIPENMQLLENRLMRFSDVDPNGHINNSRYGVFAYDVLPGEIQKRTLIDFRLNYAKEAHLGDTLEILGSIEDLSEGKKHTVIVGKNKGETSFECEMFFD